MRLPKPSSPVAFARRGCLLTVVSLALTLQRTMPTLRWGGVAAPGHQLRTPRPGGRRGRRQALHLRTFPRGAEAARPSFGTIPGLSRHLAEFLGRTWGTKLNLFFRQLAKRLSAVLTSSDRPGSHSHNRNRISRLLRTRFGRSVRRRRRRRGWGGRTGRPPWSTG